MSQLIKFICSIITAFVINSNTSGHEITQNENITIVASLLGATLQLNISKTKV